MLHFDISSLLALSIYVLIMSEQKITQKDLSLRLCVLILFIHHLIRFYVRRFSIMSNPYVNGIKTVTSLFLHTCLESCHKSTI